MERVCEKRKNVATGRNSLGAAWVWFSNLIIISEPVGIGQKLTRPLDFGNIFWTREELWSQHKLKGCLKKLGPEQILKNNVYLQKQQPWKGFKITSTNTTTSDIFAILYLLKVQEVSATVRTLPCLSPICQGLVPTDVCTSFHSFSHTDPTHPPSPRYFKLL